MVSRNYLITGLSGTGKSEICLALIKRGFFAIEADTEFGQHIDPLTGQQDPEKKQQNWVWDSNKLATALTNYNDKNLYVCGGAMNQQNFYNYFHKTFYLYCSNEILRQRLMHRIKKKGIERSPQQAQDLEDQQKWNRDSLMHAKQQGFIVIDTEQSLDKIVDEIIYLSNTA